MIDANQLLTYCTPNGPRTPVSPHLLSTDFSALPNPPCAQPRELSGCAPRAFACGCWSAAASSPPREPCPGRIPETMHAGNQSHLTVSPVSPHGVSRGHLVSVPIIQRNHSRRSSPPESPDHGQSSETFRQRILLSLTWTWSTSKPLTPRRLDCLPCFQLGFQSGCSSSMLRENFNNRIFYNCHDWRDEPFGCWKQCKQLTCQHAMIWFAQT